MPDTSRTRAALAALCPDNTTGAITPQVLRDFIASSLTLLDTPPGTAAPLNVAASGNAAAGGGRIPGRRRSRRRTRTRCGRRISKASSRPGMGSTAIP